MLKVENSSIKYNRFLTGLFLVVWSFLPFLLWEVPLSSILNGHSICVFENLTGHECWGCGMTRALFTLLHGQFEAAWAYNPTVYLVAPILVYLYVRTIVELLRRVRK